MENRLDRVQNVLVWTFVMNATVCVIKIVLGLATGVMAITADGLHSLGDTLSNIVGFVGIRLAKRKPDNHHGYGYERFEAVATLAIVALISITCYKVFEGGFTRLIHPVSVRIEPFMLAVMLASMAINVLTVVYEGGAGKKYHSPLLIADSNETKGDLWVSGGVIASTYVVSLTGWMRLDGLVAVGIGFLIVRVIWEIIVPTAEQLADAQAVEPSEVLSAAMAVPDVRFCHAIRSRGSKEAFFLDLHLGVDRRMTIEEAHDRVCHQVKKALHEQFPGLKSAMVHIEPDNEAGRLRGNSVFRDRDQYGLEESHIPAAQPH